MGGITPSWDRDFAVLKAIYSILAEHGSANTAQLCEETGLDPKTLYDVVGRLLGAGYIGGSQVLSPTGYVHIQPANETERGLREVGACPSLETAPEAFLAALSRLAKQEPDPDRRELLRSLLDKWSGPGAAQLLVKVFGLTGWFS